MKKSKTLTLSIFCLLILFSCSNEEEIAPTKPNPEEFIKSVMSLLDANTNTGITFGMLKPELEKLAKQYQVKIEISSRLDDLELRTDWQRANAMCWPWEELAISASFWDYFEGGGCVLHIFTCDGEYDGYSYMCVQN